MQGLLLPQILGEREAGYRKGCCCSSYLGRGRRVTARASVNEGAAEGALWDKGKGLVPGLLAMRRLFKICLGRRGIGHVACTGAVVVRWKTA